MRAYFYTEENCANDLYEEYDIDIVQIWAGLSFREKILLREV